MTKNQDQKNCEDSMYRSKQDFLRQKNLEQNKQRFEKEKNLIRQKKQDEERKRFKIWKWSPTNLRSYLLRFVEPQNVVAIVSVVVITYEGIRFRDQMKEQHQAELDRQAEIERPQPKSLPIEVVQTFWNTHRSQILIGIGSTVLMVTKQIYQSHRTYASLKTRAVQSETQLVRTEEILKETQQKSQTQIKKLHVTLNRLNNAVLESVEVEASLRKQVFDSQRELAVAIDERNLLQENLGTFQKKSAEQKEALRDLSLEKKVLIEKMEAQETEHAKLIVQLGESQKTQKFWNLDALRLKGELKVAETLREQQNRQLSKVELDYQSVENRTKTLESKLDAKQSRIRELESETEGLKRSNKKFKEKLQKTIERTERQALEMDRTEDDLKKYESSEGENSPNLIPLKEEIHKLINKSKTLQSQLEKTQSELNQNIILNDQLRSDIKNNQNVENQLEKLQQSQEQNANLQKKLKQQQRQLIQNSKTESQLRSELDKLRVNNQDQSKTFGGILQLYRSKEEAKYNSLLHESNQLVHSLLSQQEQTQKKSWWQKKNFSFRPQVNLVQKKEPDKKRIIDSYFYLGKGTENYLPSKIQEEYCSKTKEWKVTNPVEIQTRPHKILRGIHKMIDKIDRKKVLPADNSDKKFKNIEGKKIFLNLIKILK